MRHIEYFYSFGFTFAILVTLTGFLKQDPKFKIKLVNLLVHLLLVLEAKLTNVTKVNTLMSQKRFITMKQKKKFLFEHFRIKLRKLTQLTKKMGVPSKLSN